MSPSGVTTTTHLPQTEKQFMAAVLQLAKLCHWKVHHHHDSRRSEAGWPDLVLLRDGQLIIAELKTDTGRISKAQYDWLGALGAVVEGSANLTVAVWRPSSWSTIEELLR